mmetsp:Transcript_36668/g.89634  ORF Transcript_36668/g.89634 Transcript_36668/m.89634 type:complete len:300 (+) Transcript_36668:99-998(+)
MTLSVHQQFVEVTRMGGGDGNAEKKSKLSLSFLLGDDKGEEQSTADECVDIAEAGQREETATREWHSAEFLRAINAMRAPSPNKSWAQVSPITPETRENPTMASLKPFTLPRPPTASDSQNAMSVQEKWFPQHRTFGDRGEKPPAKRTYQCHLCDSSFGLQGQLNLHLKNHQEYVPEEPGLEKEPFQCSRCVSKFQSQELLDNHVLTYHEVSRPYSCESCGLTFRNSQQLYKHQKSAHEKLRPYLCSKCTSSFGRKSDLRKHDRLVHLKLRPFHCDRCGASFGQRGDLKKHMGTHNRPH